MLPTAHEGFDRFARTWKTLDLVENQKALAFDRLDVQFVLEKHIECLQVVDIGL